MFEDIKGFYPTPKDLIGKMWRKIPKKDRQVANYFLEGQAGQGHIIEYVIDWYRRGYRAPTIHAIEKDERLAAMLRGKKITVIDHDFLSYAGPDKYDIILGNPPFHEGEHHLLKAIDILYSGHIVYLLNAQTLKNPYTNARKKLASRLEELVADIEYLQGKFENAERRTSVELALIHIHVNRQIEDDLFEGVTDAEEIYTGNAHEQREVAEKDSIRGIVADYNRTVELGTKVIMDFYENYYHVASYLHLLVGDEEKSLYLPEEGRLTALMKAKLNKLVCAIRKSYWEKTLKLDAVKKRLTKKKADEFYHNLQANQYMDFTENNIRTFILNLIRSYEDILTEAVVNIFDKLTKKHAWDEELHNGNVHYFDGWKTNKAFYVNKKVIIPYWNSYSTGFWDAEWKRWNLGYETARELSDIDKVMSYFDGMSNYHSVVEALEHAFQQGESRKIKSTYFEITVYKKGTIHLTFLNEDVRRRFNVTACKGKNWLPQDYGKKSFKTLDPEHQMVVNAFEGRESYDLNVNTARSLFRSNPLKKIGVDLSGKVSYEILN